MEEINIIRELIRTCGNEYLVGISFWKLSTRTSFSSNIIMNSAEWFYVRLFEKMMSMSINKINMRQNMFIYGELYEMKRLGKRAKGGKDLWRNLIISERKRGRIWTITITLVNWLLDVKGRLLRSPPKMYTEVELWLLCFLAICEEREFTICCDWLSECCYVDVCFKHHCDKENCLYYEAREMGFDFGIPNILFNSFR